MASIRLKNARAHWYTMTSADWRGGGATERRTRQTKKKQGVEPQGEKQPPSNPGGAKQENKPRGPGDAKPGAARNPTTLQGHGKCVKNSKKTKKPKCTTGERPRAGE